MDHARRDATDAGHRAQPFRWVLLFCAVLLGLMPAACGSDHESSAGNEPFYAPDALGPFAVGRTSFTIVDADRDGRELPVDAWYPVDPENATGAPALYQVSILVWIFPLVFTTPSEIALDAPPASEARRFPLIVFSHGSGGLRYQSFFLTEILASHGFVVVAPSHVGNTLLDEIGGTSAPMTDMMVARPLDVSYLITRMLEKNEDPADPFYRTIDADRIGVCGHSFGGFTSLAMAAGFGADPPPDLAPDLPEELQLDLPEDLEPVPPDPRVDAIVPIAPVSSWFGDSELAGINVPTLIIGGTHDTTTPIATESVRAYELIPAPVFRADLDGAVHFSFSNSCDLIQGMREKGIPQALIDALLGTEFTAPCGPPSLDVEEAHRITNLYTVSLFEAFVEGDSRYEKYLTEAYAEASEPNVTFYANP